MISELAVADIEPSRWDLRAFPYNDETLQELVASIKRHGILTHLRVFVNERGEYELLSGHRRLAAAMEAGLERVPVDVVEHKGAFDDILPLLHEEAIIDNLHREDFGPMEEARAIRGLMEEHGYVQEEVARRLQKSAKWVSDRVCLLRLAASVQDAVAAGAISLSIARRLHKLNHEDQIRALEMIEKTCASSRDTDTIIKKIIGGNINTEFRDRVWIRIRTAAEILECGAAEVARLCETGTIKAEKKEYWRLDKKSVEQYRMNGQT